jgi:hypothetical protein
MDTLNILFGLGRKRHHTARIIKKRKKIAKDNHLYFRYSGILNRHNLSCNCGLCNAKHPQRIKKPQTSLKTKEKLRTMKEEINELY